MSSVLRTVMIVLLGIHFWEIALFDALVFLNIQFHHANIGLPERWDRLFRVFLASPAMHKVHHSDDPSEYNSNFSFFLSAWDRLFGTFQLNPNPQTITFGLRDAKDPESQRLTQLLRKPFVGRTIQSIESV